MAGREKEKKGGREIEKVSEVGEERKNKTINKR